MLMEYSVLFPGMPWIQKFGRNKEEAVQKALDHAKWLVEMYDGMFKLENEIPSNVRLTD